jgi:hypothetical protein
VLPAQRQGSQNEQIQRALRQIDALSFQWLPYYFYRSNTLTPVEAQGGEILIKFGSTKEPKIVCAARPPNNSTPRTWR